MRPSQNRVRGPGSWKSGVPSAGHLGVTQEAESIWFGAYCIQIRAATTAFLLNPVLPWKLACSLYRTFFHCLPSTDRSFSLLTSLPSHVHACCLFLFRHSPPPQSTEPRPSPLYPDFPGRPLPAVASQLLREDRSTGWPSPLPPPTPGERCGAGFMCKERIPHCTRNAL